MLQGVGKETVHKLSDIQAAALASSRIADTEILQDFTRHTSSITTGEPPAITLDCMKSLDSTVQLLSPPSARTNCSVQHTLRQAVVDAACALIAYSFACTPKH